MAGPCGTEAPAARWKRHIVRQLRQRDRTQKALFLELVPACECASGGGAGVRRRLWRGQGSGTVSGFSGCDASAPTPSHLQSLGPAAPPSVTPYLRLVTSLLFAVRALLKASSWTELLLVPLPSSPLGAWICLPGAVLLRHLFISQCSFCRVSCASPCRAVPKVEPVQSIWFP